MILLNRMQLFTPILMPDSFCMKIQAPGCIEKPMQYKMKLWVLTGDKMNENNGQCKTRRI